MTAANRGGARRAAGTRLVLVALAPFLAVACFRPPSDEAVLRKAFAVPADVRLADLKSPTPNNAWFGREGLYVSAVFAFEPEQFERYRRQAMDSGRWKPMPIERPTLLKMLGVASHRQALERINEEYRKRGEDKWIHAVPSEDEMLAGWAPPRLPLDAPRGLFRCLTAGDNLMYATKRECVEKPGDQNDFMLGVLDEDRRELRVVAHTAY